MSKLNRSNWANPGCCSICLFFNLGVRVAEECDGRHFCVSFVRTKFGGYFCRGIIHTSPGAIGCTNGCSSLGIRQVKTVEDLNKISSEPGIVSFLGVDEYRLVEIYRKYDI